MPTYPYECESCEAHFEIEMRITDYDPKAKPPCPECSSEETIRIFTVPYVNFPGDDWTTKNNRVQRQMRKKNERLKDREREQKGDGTVPSLVPNVGGERVESWSEARKLAKSKGLSTSSYDRRVHEEKPR